MRSAAITNVRISDSTVLMRSNPPILSCGFERPLLPTGLFGKQECDLQAHAPRRSQRRVNSVSVELKSDVDRLRSQPHDAADAAAQRHNPSAAVRGLPVGRDSWLPGEVIALRQVVIDEILQEELIHVWQAGMTGYRPDVIYKKTECPFARLYQDDRSRPNAEFSLTQDARPCRRR